MEGTMKGTYEFHTVADTGIEVRRRPTSPQPYKDGGALVPSSRSTSFICK